jgi:hypothetical protein
VLVKIVIVLAALAGFFYLFRQSIDSVRSEPYVIQRQYTEPWTLAIESATTATSPILVARPPEDFGSRLFDQIFERAMESMKGSFGGGVPLVLRGEYEQSLAGRYTPEALLELARAGGLDRTAFTPVCVSIKRVSEPGRTRQLYYVIFESPAFVEFRARLGREVAGQSSPAFAPAALSPVLIVGGTEGDFDRWLPIAAAADRDFVAPIAIN